MNSHAYCMEDRCYGSGACPIPPNPVPIARKELFARLQEVLPPGQDASIDDLVEAIEDYINVRLQRLDRAESAL